MTTCPRCGTPNQTGAKFCQECGGSLSAPAGAELSRPPIAYTPAHLSHRILQSKDSIEGERKQVTILFCDVVESTRLASELGAEAIHALFSDLFRVALDEIHRYEGTLNQFLGDGFMAIFGAPIAHEDHATRAGLASLGIRDTVARYRAEPPFPGWERVHVRMGLNSGAVVVAGIGNDLRMDYTAIGDTVHFAARLQATAQPDEIVMSASTARAAADDLRWHPLEPVAVRGKDEPIGRSRLVGRGVRTERAARRRTPFVGRQAELDTLFQAFDDVHQGQGVVLDIEGEPGVGKSRLLLEFERRIANRARIARGHCISYGSQIPNVPIVDTIRGLAGITAADAADQILARLQGVLGPDADEAVTYLGSLLGVPASIERLNLVDPATVRGRTAEALMALIQTRSREQVLVVECEDLHWADPSSLEFLGGIVTGISRVPVLVIFTFRSGSAPPWDGASAIRRLVLPPLNEGESAAVVHGFPEARSFSDPEVDFVLRQGEGNPFFLEELARAVAEGATADVPGDVVDVLAARIDRLPDDGKEVLRTASVIGREFEIDLLGRVVADGTDPRSVLPRLVDLGFVEPGVEGPFRCSFVHALTQEVAYGGMLTTRRRSLHTSVAEALVDRFAGATEQACEEIARHLLLGIDPERAIPFLEVANAKAIRSHSLEEAKGFFDEALRLLESQEPTRENLASRLTLVLQQFPVFHFTHRHEEYAQLIERYATIADELDEPALRGPFLAQQGHRRWVFARYAEARPLLEEALRLCERVGDAVGAAHAEMMLLWTDVWVGNYEAADHHGQAALHHLETTPVPILLTFSFVGLSLSRTFRGHWDQAADWAERAHRYGIEIGDDGMASFGSTFGCFVELWRGDIAAALELGQRALDEAPTVYFEGWAQMYLAAAMCKAGQVHPSVDIFAQVAAFVRSSRHDSGFLILALLLAESWLLAGDRARAREVATEIGSWAAKAGVPFVQAGMETVLGQAALEEGDARQAADLLHTAAQRFGEIQADNRRAIALAGEGRARAAFGDVDTARPLLQEALSTFQRLGTQGEPERVREAIAQL